MKTMRGEILRFSDSIIPQDKTNLFALINFFGEYVRLAYHKAVARNDPAQLNDVLARYTEHSQPGERGLRSLNCFCVSAPSILEIETFRLVSNAAKSLFEEKDWEQLPSAMEALRGYVLLWYTAQSSLVLSSSHDIFLYVTLSLCALCTALMVFLIRNEILLHGTEEHKRIARIIAAKVLLHVRREEEALICASLSLF